MDPESAFRENQEALLRYLVRYTADPDLAADLVQETFVRFLENQPNAHTARSWLFKVAANLACDAARGRTRRQRLLFSQRGRLPYGDPPASADHRVEMAERTKLVQEALLSLSAKERTALLLREEGFRHHEIAAAIETSPSSVGTLIARAVRKLASTIDVRREDLRL